MASPCDSIRAGIADLEAELRDLQTSLGTATPPEKGDIIARIRAIQQHDLPEQRRALQMCLANPAPGNPIPAPNIPIPGIRILAWEFNQGLPDYQLIAGKDMLVRIFLAASPIPPGGFGIFPALDYASLRVTTPRG